MMVQRSDLIAIKSEIERLWEQNRQLREKIARSWELGVPDGVAVYNDANISIGSGSWTALTFNSERRDNAAFHSTVSNTGRLTVPAGKGGWYVISGHVEFASNSTGWRGIGIRLNGSAYIAISGNTAISGTTHQFSIATIYLLADEHYVELLLYQNSGGNLNANAVANYSPEFRMVRVV